MKTFFSFHHGLGDCANAACLCSLYARRGYALEIQCDPDKAPLFRAAGATIVNRFDPTGKHRHDWLHTHGNEVWEFNKSGCNLSREPLPNIGNPASLWPELCAAGPDLDMESEVTPDIDANIERTIADLPRPLILMHTMGNTSPERKNYDAHQTTLLYHELLDRTPGTLLLLDWDARVPRCTNHRVRHMVEHFPRLSLPETYRLMTRADLFIGVDSGPLHLVNLTRLPAIGLWGDHTPERFAIPRDLTLHLTANSDAEHRIEFNTLSPRDPGLPASFVAQHAERALRAPRWLPDRLRMRDVQLQGFLDKTRSHSGHLSNYIDRNRSFAAAMDWLKDVDRPTIVETGTIRSPEDWAGAGYSTYLLGAFAWAKGGTLVSVDLSANFCKYSASATKELQGSGVGVKVIASDSRDFLRSYNGRPIDLFYSDSADVGTPGYQECCVDEVRLAIPLLADRGAILIDDTVHDGQWNGKGSLAVPWLMEQGWRLDWSGYQAFLTSPTKVKVAA